MFKEHKKISRKISELGRGISKLTNQETKHREELLILRKELDSIKGEYKLSKYGQVSLKENLSKICTRFALGSKTLKYILLIQSPYYYKSNLAYEETHEEGNPFPCTKERLKRKPPFRVYKFSF